MAIVGKHVCICIYAPVNHISIYIILRVSLLPHAIYIYFHDLTYISSTHHISIVYHLPIYHLSTYLLCIIYIYHLFIILMKVEDFCSCVND